MKNEFWDTSIYIEKIRSGLLWFNNINENIYMSSVVIGELATGFIGRKNEYKIFENYIVVMNKVNRILTPRYSDWLLAGTIIGKILHKRPDLKNKKALLFNDCLIATSSNIINAKVVTKNKKDFELIKEYFNYQVEYR